MQFWIAARSTLYSVPIPVRIITLGMLSWALCAAFPCLYRNDPMRFGDLCALLLGPLVLGAGSLLSRREHRAAPFVLLTGFPIALSLGISRIAHDEALSMFSPATLLLMIASFGAYASTALQASYATIRLRPVDHKPLGEVAQIAPSMRKRQAATLVLAILTVGALIVLAFGSSATPAHYREHWGTAAGAGAVVSALAAGIVGSAMLAIIAPGLRAERSEAKPPADRAKRLSWLMLVAVSGVILYVLAR